MNDTSPRLSDEDPYDTVMGSAFADSGYLRETAHVDPQYERDHDPEARFMRENGMTEEALDAGNPTEIDAAREHGREEIEERYGAGQQSSTARLIEDAALYGARPIASETDTRHVWLNRGQPISFDDALPPHVQAAFDQIGEAMNMIVEAAAPEGYQMHDQSEHLRWGLVNLFHGQVNRVEKRIAQLSQQALDLRKTESRRVREQGRDPASLELETTAASLQSEAEMRDRFENFRDYAADSYLHHTAKVWEPRRGSNVSQTRDTAQRIDGREYVRALKAGHDTRELPQGTLIAVAGSKIGPDRDTIYARLDRERTQHPDMVLAHGGARDGVQKIAATWARNRGVREMPFLPDWNAHKSRTAAILQRDTNMLRAGPAKVLHFTAPDVRLPRICEEATRRGIEVEHVRDAPARQQAAALAAETARRPGTLDKLHEREASIPHREDLDNPLPGFSADQLAGPIEISLPNGTTAVLETDSASRANGTRTHTDPGFAPASLSRHDNPVRPETIDRQRDIRYAGAVVGSPALAAEPQAPAYTAGIDRDTTAAEAFQTFVDKVLPDTPEHENTRKRLYHRVVDTVHAMIAGPLGLTEEVDRHAHRQKELHHEFTGGEITLNQMDDTAGKLQTASSSLERLESARAELATTAERQTGDRWTPRPVAQIGEAPAVSAAAAEAIQLVEQVRRERDLARLPKGFAVAVAAYGDDADRETVRAKLDQALERRPDMWIAHANSEGTLAHVAEWATEKGVKQVTYELDKRDTGNAAIRQRDHKLIDTVRPRAVIEFTAEGAKKTFLVDKAQNEKIPVWPINMTRERAARQQQEQDKTANRAQTEQFRETLSMTKSAGRSW